MSTIATSVNLIQLSVETQLHVSCLTAHPIDTQQCHTYRLQSECIESKWGNPN